MFFKDTDVFDAISTDVCFKKTSRIITVEFNNALSSRQLATIKQLTDTYDSTISDFCWNKAEQKYSLFVNVGNSAHGHAVRELRDQLLMLMDCFNKDM